MVIWKIFSLPGNKLYKIIVIKIKCTGLDKLISGTEKRIQKHTGINRGGKCKSKSVGKKGLFSK
jgi:hypothetical protein